MQTTLETKRLILAGLIGLIFFVVTNWYPVLTGEAFEEPDALKAPIAKEEAADAAAAHLQAMGIAGPFETFVMFQSNTDLGGYLQKSGLAKEYDRRYDRDYPIDYYQVELTDGDRIWLVDVDMMEARVVGWRETTADPDAAPDRATGERLALDYAAARGFDPEALALVSADAGKFVYEAAEQVIGEAPLRLEISVGPQAVAGFIADFDVPETYLEWYRDQQQWMDLVGAISLLLYIALAFAAVIFAVVYRRTATFGRGVILTVLFIVLSTINYINTYPVVRLMTAGEPGGELIAWIASFFNHLFTFVLAAAMYFGLVSGDAAFRARGVNLWPRWREHNYGRYILGAMGRGYPLAFVLLGVQGILYWIGERLLGVWSVNDPSFSTFNTLVPALFPLTAWVAAISEEAIYRVFGIAFFRKLFRNTAVAAALSSVLWAVAHIGYPIFPAYTRLVEVTILGFLFSWVYLRYGFAAAVFTHAIFDSILMALSLMSMGGTANVVLAAGYMALPAIIGYALNRLHGRFKPRLRPAAPLPPH
jgi:hypothetical protein